MKRLLFLLLVITITGCSKDKKHGDFYHVFNSLSNAGTFEEASEYYSSGTVDMVNRASRIGLVDKKEMLSLLPLFSRRTMVRILEEKVSGDSAVINLRYSDHPVENMVGYDMAIRLVHQGGRWRVNYENELKKVIEKLNEKKELNYIKEKVQVYQ